MPGLFSRNQAPAPRDFRPEDNPSSPVGVFFTVLRINFGNIVKLNLFYFLFTLPSLAWMFYNVMLINGVLENATILQQELSFLDIVPYLSYFLIGLCVTEIPLGPAKCGMAYVMRFLSQDEHSFIIDDFLAAYKENWKQGIIANLVINIVYVLVYIATISYSVRSAGNPWLMVPVYVLFVLFALFCIMQQYVFPLIVTYEMDLRQILRTALLLTLARLPRNILSFVLASAVGAAIAVFSLMQNMTIGITVGILYFAILGFAIAQMIRSSFVHRTFRDMLVTPEDAEAQGKKKKDDDVLPEDRA